MRFTYVYLFNPQANDTGMGVSLHFVSEQVEHREVERVLLGHTGEELGLEPL